jgi:SAM-dependent methyltransferase
MYDQVKHYYGTVLTSSDDLKTDACCTDAEMPTYVKEALVGIHDEVMARYYGCGLVAPEKLEGMRVLDLGCGSGRDCYVLSRFVGPDGFVLGVDMTDEQLAVAERHIGYHTETYGYAQPNVAFLKGYIERLDDLGLEDASFDVIVSNCVINLSPDKDAVLRQVYRLLKPGGELYFSDVYADRRVPDVLRDDPMLYGECLGGALYWNDFLTLAKRAGFADPRLVEDRPIAVNNEVVRDKVGRLRFFSATYRLFKLDDLEPACEDYGQAVVYKGDIPHSEAAFVLDKHHVVETGRMFPVCGNTYRMFHETRFRPHFDFFGSWDTHFGIFDGCGTEAPFGDEEKDGGGKCC